MREIEFRAFFNGKMIYRPELEFCKTQGGDYIIRLMDDKTNFCLATTYEDELKIMQYVGVKDKNNIKIYEDDVVINERGEKGIIVFYYKVGFVSKYIFPYNWDAMEPIDGCLENQTIIGNIHENEKILEDK